MNMDDSGTLNVAQSAKRERTERRKSSKTP
jgi:hypothetical protein